jgi:hypothetical protein
VKEKDMDNLKPIFTAAVGDPIALDTVSKGPVFTNIAVLERVGGGGGNQEQWTDAELANGGARSEAREGVDGYNVILFPHFGDGGSIDATLRVGGQEAKVTLSNNNSAGWKIFVF